MPSQRRPVKCLIALRGGIRPVRKPISRSPRKPATRHANHRTRPMDEAAPRPLTSARPPAALRARGAEVNHGPDGTWRVAGRGIGGLTEPADVLDMGNSGTAARLLCGILASHALFAVMTGDASLRGRPMR